MNCGNCNKELDCSASDPLTNCDACGQLIDFANQESCEECCCRHERYIRELFKRTNDLRTLVTGEGVGPYKISFVSDAGQNNFEQKFLCESLIKENPEIMLFGGDNNYEDGKQSTIYTNWEHFNDQIDQMKVFPALGNHDLDNDPNTPGLPQYNKFPYLPGNRRYYHLALCDQLIDVFVLSSGWSTQYGFVEPDGNDINSIQYNWFRSALANSCGKWKIVMFHHPFVSGVSSAINSGRIVPEMNWGFKDMDVDIILNGHTHTDQHLIVRERGEDKLHMVDCSSAVRGGRDMSRSQTIYGSDADVTEMVWAFAPPGQSGDPHYVILDIIGNSMIVSFKHAWTGRVAHSFAVPKGILK